MNATGKRPRRWLGGKYFLSSYIIMALISLVAGSFLLTYFFECENLRKTIDFEHPVKAVYTKVVSTVANLRTGSYRYYPFYEYTSPEGVYYCGEYKWYEIESVAESYLGKEITIYIDGKGNNTPRSDMRNQKIWAVVVSVILLTAGVAIIAILIIPHRWKPPKPPKQRKPPFLGVGPI